MSEEETKSAETPEAVAEETVEAAEPKKAAQPANPKGFKEKFSRRTLRKKGREARAKRILSDKEFAKAWFEGKSKRSADRKKAFRTRYASK